MELCAHLPHAANGWRATHRVGLASGATVGVCDMCLMRAAQLGPGPWFTVSCRHGVVWVDARRVERARGDAVPA